MLHAGFLLKRGKRSRSNAPRLQTVAVDLTPIFPGGENGGAKVFTLELLHRLAELAPQTQFVLLTQEASHQELAPLDSANMRRITVLDRRGHAALWTLDMFSHVLVHLPRALGRTAGKLGYSMLTLAKRSGSRSLLNDLNVDLLFCPFTATTYSEPLIPIVSVIHDLQHSAYPEFFAMRDVVHRTLIFTQAARRSTILVANSEYTRDAAIIEARRNPDDIKTVPLQISQNRLDTAPRDEAILDRLQLVAGKYLIYPANFWKHKNHEMLLTAFGLARHSGLADDIRLVCTGAPSQRQRWLVHAARRLALEDRILFPGYLGDAEFLATVANSAGLIYPSLHEGFGLPVVEALAAGVPVACSNVTSLPEVAGDAAILFDPRIPEDIAQAMITMTQDKELISRLVQAGKQRAARFSDSRKMAEQYWEIFQQAVGREVRSGRRWRVSAGESREIHQ